jgi:hypothetical protein
MKKLFDDEARLLKIKKEKLSRFQKNMEPIIIGLVTLPF